MTYMSKEALKERLQRSKRGLGFALTLSVLALALVATPAAAAELATEVSLLIGYPPTATDGEALDSEGILVVPGIVIPVHSDERLDDVLRHPGGEPEARLLVRNTRLKQVANSLLDSLRLGNVEVRYQMRLDLMVDAQEDLPAPSSSSDIQIAVKLLGYNDKTASYEVQFFHGATPLTQTPLTVERGKQAVVGGLDGEDAPYLFLVVAPNASGPVEIGSEPLRVTGDVQPPIALHKPAPAYTPEAKEKRIEGIVIVQTLIDIDGQVKDVRVLKGLPEGLNQAATDAIRSWRFEPATLHGEPVKVLYNLTINFRLK